MIRNTVRLVWFLGALALITSAVAFAAAGGRNASTSSINLVVPAASTALASAGPAYGQSVTFDVSTNATNRPFVHLMCSQNGALVLQSWQAWFFGATGPQLFALGPSPAWQGGAAECTAYLENWDSYSKNGKITVLASTAFHVDG